MKNNVTQELITTIQNSFDSLSNANDSLQQRLDSVQQDLDTIISIQKTINESGSSNVDNGPMDYSGLWGLFGLALISAAVIWLAKRLYKRIRKNKTKNMENNKKVLEANYDVDEDEFSSTSDENKPMAASRCIAAVATDTRKVKNQDSYCKAYVEKANAQIIAVADGVGSSLRSEEGSSFVAAKAVELVNAAIERDEHHIDFDDIFDKIQTSLDTKIETDYADTLSELPNSSFGTTLIIGIDFPDRFVAAYVGNGSIWHVSGLFNSFPSMVSLPWNAVNLLRPDTIMSGGKEALYKLFFYKGERKHHQPTVLQLSKLNDKPGDMFIITTDGVYSSDHAIAGKDEEGEIWIPSTAQFTQLHDALKKYVEGDEDINDETLQQMLVTYLANLKESQAMDDDTTLGVFISANAKMHFMDNRKTNEKN